MRWSLVYGPYAKDSLLRVAEVQRGGKGIGSVETWRNRLSERKETQGSESGVDWEELFKPRHENSSAEPLRQWNLRKIRDGKKVPGTYQEYGGVS